MKFGTLAFTLLGVLVVGDCAHGQINYVSQARRVQAMRGAGFPPSCVQTTIAQDFGPFNEQVSCSSTTASQNSVLSANSMVCQGNASQGTQPPMGQTATSISEFTVVFDLKQSMHYTLSGQVGAPGSGVGMVRLTGPSEVLILVQTAMSFDFCGTLAPGQYEMYARSSGIPFANHDFNLRIVRPGDVNGDDLVNVDDLLGVINAWGACANPQNCPQDITCNNAVDIDDLLSVINNWSP